MDRTIDLNDLRYFALIVEHGGFSAAERVARITKSKLSRRVAMLEERLGARLLQRSTRRLALTEAGRAFYDHCAAMLVEAEAATQAIDQLRSEPSGTVRVTSPSTLTYYFVARIIADFMREHAKVRVELEATDRVVNLIDEKVDIALRAVMAPLEPGLTSRQVASGRLILVASPEYVRNRPSIEKPADLAGHDTVGMLNAGPEQTWNFTSVHGATERHVHRPRLLCSDYTALYTGVQAGVGVGFLPLRLVWQGLNDGLVVRVAKEWGTPEVGIHVVFPSRRGMLPSVRSLIDYIAKQLPTSLGI